MEIMNHTLKKSTHLFALLLSIGLIAGCGAERDTAFNPDTDTEETGDLVDSSLIEAGNQKETNILLDEDNRRLQVIKNENDFSALLDSYSLTNFDEPDFENGQVVLIDMGETDSCEERLTFSSLKAYETGDKGVKVVITYNEQAAATSDCTSSVTRPYRVHYIESTGSLVFEESMK